MFRRAIIGAALVAPVAGLAYNLASLPEHYGYEPELALLIVLWLAAAILAYYWFDAAVFLYCAGALLPVGSMLQYYESIGGGFSALALTPFVGIVIVAMLTRDEKATIIYGLVALGASLVFGLISNDLGQGGALAFLASIITPLALVWLDCNVQRAHKKLDNQEGQIAQLKQESEHDRRAIQDAYEATGRTRRARSPD